MKRLIKTDSITVNQLVEMCNKFGISLDAKISIMGAETRYVVFEDGYITLDECNYLDELNEEYVIEE